MTSLSPSFIHFLSHSLSHPHSLSHSLSLSLSFSHSLSVCLPLTLSQSIFLLLSLSLSFSHSLSVSLCLTFRISLTQPLHISPYLSLSTFPLYLFSVINHLDISQDGRFMQSNCSAYELLFCETSTGKQLTSATELRDVQWDSWTCTLGDYTLLISYLHFTFFISTPI